MRNGTKHKMMPLLSPFMTCVLSRLFCQMKWQMCRSGTAVVYSYTRLKHTGSHRPIDSHSIPYLHREKIQDLEQGLPSLLQSYELQGKQPFVSDFSRLLPLAIEKGRGPILYSRKTLGPHGDYNI